MNAPHASYLSAQTTIERLVSSLSRVVKGRDDTIKLVLTALLADGHVLIEDYPGSGKTTLTKSLGRLIGRDPNSDVPGYILPFRRVQFTPDMLPQDVLGVNIFDRASSRFEFLHGPVFAHVLLADEINRAGPKVQSAFLECMAEKQVTIDNQTHRLDRFFFVLGTQNPLDIAGTYPLPIVQLDRFILKIPMSYVDAQTENSILAQAHEIAQSVEHLEPVCCRHDILTAQDAARSVRVSDPLREAIVAVAQATRSNPLLQFGASTRAAIMLQAAMKAWALVQGRDFATEEDLATIAPYVLLHRLKFHPGAGTPVNALRELMAPILEKLIGRRGL